MKRRTSRPALPLMAAQLALSSWEVIARRSLMMAQGTCSPAEYQRMVAEKMDAAQASTVALLTSAGPPSLSKVLAPWHDAVTANAQRLRRK